MTEELLGEFRNEVNMLARLRHPNIISLLGCSPHPPLLIITELMPRGSMYSVLYESKHALSNDLKMDMLVQCAKVSSSNTYLLLPTALSVLKHLSLSFPPVS